MKAARSLRMEMTRAEQVLWDALRRQKLEGMRFRRQHAIGRFVLDFYCPACKLAVEVDGEVHDDPAQAERDAARTAALAALGVAVVRLRNEEVLSDLPRALKRIARAINEASEQGRNSPPY